MSIWSKYKKLIIALLLVASAASIVFLFLVSKGAIKEKPPTVTTIEQIKPGVSTREDVLSLLGLPSKETTQGNQTTDQFKIEQSINRQNEVVFENNTAQLVKEIVPDTDNRNPRIITDKYGQSKDILYGPDTKSGIYLYVYPSKGIAYLANQQNKDNGVLFEVWFFTPTDLDTFISKWASDYSKIYPIQGVF